MKGLIPYKSIVKEKQQRQVLMLPPFYHCTLALVVALAPHAAPVAVPTCCSLGATWRFHQQNMADECDIMWPYGIWGWPSLFMETNCAMLWPWHILSKYNQRPIVQIVRDDHPHILQKQSHAADHTRRPVLITDCWYWREAAIWLPGKQTHIISHLEVS